MVEGEAATSQQDLGTQLKKTSDPYARALLRFVQAAVAGRRRVEAFALGTRLTRITRELGAHDPDVALAQAAASGKSSQMPPAP